MKFAVVNTKGGVGKTTLAVHLATLLCREFPGMAAPPVPLGRTLLIDGDPQASAASWAAWRRQGEEAGQIEGSAPTTVCLTGRAIFDEGRRLASTFDHTVVDAGAGDTASLRGALLLAERAIVPIGASTLDAAALTDLIEIADLARDLNPALRLRVMLARIDARARDVGQMLAHLAELNLEVIDARICERVAYRRAVGDGLTVGELAGVRRDSVAAAEIDAAFREVTR
jgi:chromosome partitioning protein